MVFHVNKLDARHHFSVTGVSYIGEPKSNTAVYITKKVEALLEKLWGVQECLVYAGKEIDIPDALRQKHCFIVSENPQMAYSRFAEEFAEAVFEEERKRSYRLTPQGYYLGENTRIGEHVYIEPGCLIGHEVEIGDYARIYSGAQIQRAVIGNHFVCNQNAIIGSPSFTMAEDEQGNKFRIPSLGRVLIGSHAEIGAGSNIACGSCSDTVIEANVKLDALVHIGHDVHIGRNAELTAGVIVAGFTVIEEHTYIGVNASIRNRITLGRHSVIGMGANVTASVDPQRIVAGNPARPLEAKKEADNVKK